jgi:flagellar biosynthesis/type III secretory pathway M-ring protein FliF/YscJ
LRRFVFLIEIAFVILVLSIIYRRYIKPFRDAMRNARPKTGERQYEQRGPVHEATRPSSINANPHKPIDKSNVQDAEFEDIS